MADPRRLTDFRDAGLAEVDNLATLEDSPLERLAAAVTAAEQGDEFDLEMIESGFYGEEDSELEELLRPSKALQGLADYLIDLRESAIESRWGHDENTLLNFAFRAGHHYVEVDPARKAVVSTPAPKEWVRRRIMKIEPWFRSQHSKLSRSKPVFTIRPGSPYQLEDRDAAVFAEKLATRFRDKAWSTSKRGEIAQWELLAGMIVYHVGVEWKRTDDYMSAGGEPLYQPEIVHELFPPQQCWADEDISRIEDMRWFGVDRYPTVGEARARFAQPLHNRINPEMLPSERGRSLLRRIRAFSGRENPWQELSTEAGTRTPAHVDGEEKTTICEWWAKPGIVLQIPFLDGLDPELVPFEVLAEGGGGEGPVILFPQGLRIQFTPEGDILEISDNFLGRLAFREIGFTQSPGFWRYAPATPMRTLQQAYNWLHNIREMHGMKVGNTPLLVPRDARMKRRGSVIGGVLRVLYRANRFGAKPEYMNLPNWPGDMVQFQQELDKAWQEIGAFHDPSQGALPSGEISGIAISLLQEADLSQLGFAGEELESAARDIARMELLFTQQFFPRNDPRLVELAGGALYQLQAFMNADLENGVDLRVVEGSAVPRSPAAQEAKAKELWAMGAMTDRYGRPDSRKMLEIFGFGDSGKLYEEEEIDIQNARQVQEMILGIAPPDALLVLQVFMESGQLPPILTPQPEDDHLIHEAEHRMRLKQLRSDPRVHPINRALLQLVWKIHVAAVAPILQMADPAVLMGALGSPAAMGQEGEGEEGGGQGQVESGGQRDAA